MHDCTQEQNGSLYFFFHRSAMQIAVSVEKDLWDPDILPPWQRDAMTSLTIERAINTPVDRVGIRQMDKVAGGLSPLPPLHSLTTVTPVYINTGK